MTRNHLMHRTIHDKQSFCKWYRYSSCTVYLLMVHSVTLPDFARTKIGDTA